MMTSSLSNPAGLVTEICFRSMWLYPSMKGLGSDVWWRLPRVWLTPR